MRYLNSIVPFLVIALIVVSIFAVLLPSVGASFSSNIAPTTVNSSSISVSAGTPVQGSPAGSYPWKAVGPENFLNPQSTQYSPSQIASGHVGDGIAIYWKNPDIIYLELGTGPGYLGPSSAGGVYKTTDGGRTWSAADFGLPFGVGNGILMNQSNPDQLLVAIFTGIYRTDDGGAYWYKVSSYQDAASFIMVGNTVYAASTTGVIMSSDFGTTWTDLFNSSQTSPVVWTGSVSVSGNYIYSITNLNRVLLRSSDLGKTWQQVYDFSSVTDNLWTVSASPSDPKNVYVTVGPTTGNAYLYHSTDGGSTFAPVPLSFAGSSTLVGVGDIVFDPVNSSVLYAVGGAYEAKSVDGGNTWAQGAQGTDNRAILVDPLNDSLLWLGSDQGIYASSDGGSTWTSLNSGLSDVLSNGLGVSSDGQLAILNMQDYSAFITHDGGKSWVGGNEPSVPLGGEGTRVYVDPYNSAYVYGVTMSGAVEVSNDNGQTFHQQGFTASHAFPSSNAGVVEADPYATTQVYLGGVNGMYRSSDYGQSWSLWSGSPSNVTSIGFTGGGGMVTGTYDGVEYYSQGTWSHSQGIGGSTNYWSNIVTSVAVDPGNTSIVYATTGIAGNGVIYRSEDSGHTFSVLNSTLAPRYNDDLQISVSVFTLQGMGSPSPVIAATLYGIYISTDMGATWNPINYNLHDGEITGVALESGNLYISTWGEGMLEYPNFSLTSLPATFEGSVDKTGYAITVDGSLVPINGLHFKIFLAPGSHQLSITYQGSTYTKNATLTAMQDYAVAVTQTPPSYSISFVESGLESGKTWSVTLNNTTKTSTADSISFSGPNGTYSFTVATTDKTYSPSISTGSLTVKGASVTESIVFSIVKFKVSFTESGLPSGTLWSVTLNGSAESSTTNTITFNMPNGTFSYSVSTGNNLYASPSPSSSFTVNGTSVTVPIIFTQLTYSVTFTESGLTNGSVWYVTFNGTTKSSTGNISFSITNGTYSYSIASIPGYSILSVQGYNESTGSLVVKGYNLTHPVTFTQVKGYFAGSIYPSNASISINGTLYQSVNGKFNISLGTGNYEVKISAPGYTTYTTNITISSSSVSKLPIQSLTKVSKPLTSSFLFITLMGIIVIGAIVAAVVFATTRSRRKKS